MLNNKVKRLVNNIGIFAIGNLGSKLISFILIPIFTRYMSTTDFGHVDLITTTVNMLLPVVALSIADAVFRFAMEKRINQAEVLSTGFLFTMFMILITFAMYPILLFFKVSYVVYIILYLSIGLIQNLLQNFVRGIGFVRVFAINGLVSSVVMAFVGTWLIVYKHTAVQGYLVALIISAAISVAFMVFTTKIWHYFRFNNFSLHMLKSMFRYSIPLIPNAFFWFFTNDASRYFIVGFVGLAANGLYAVATKLPTMINVLYTVFSQAWQISAVEEYESDRDERFFSNVFNANIGLSVVIIGGILIILKPIMSVYVANTYFVAWKVVPSLLFATFFSNLSSFLGTIYLATKKTAGIMKTTIYGMIANVFLNFLLIPTLGLQGAGIGAALGFAFVAFIRLRDIRKYIFIHVNWQLLFSSLFILFLMSVLQFFCRTNSLVMYSLLVVLEIILVFVNLRPIFDARLTSK
ncbi:oligosaccharide flippase family protein [Lactiplantibacillus dongliensis]|uniref:Oligosaccharide flippase family protein n=1 Tax=Lactiplantibacillus dongliensis TaxID=2559919 RepID=A0ABW1R384_9LACO|nr:oligosaccharide flippase family protein [Lactiplantibacillus dongliensis]